MHPRLILQHLHPRLTLLLVAFSLAVLVVAPGGQGRSSESVTCSTTIVLHDSTGRMIDLTGKWLASDKGTYSIRQIGNCGWWSGSGTGFSNVFFGTMSSTGSTVFGLWADVPAGNFTGSGSLILSVRGARLLLKRGATGAPFGGRIWKKV